MRKFIYKYITARFYHILFGINTRIEELDLTEKKCLCLAPHPDDESIGAGGALAKYNKNFDVICLTDGSRAGTNLTKEELIKTRAEEFKAAMQTAGIENYKMLNMPDKAMIINSYENQIDIAEYDYIFAPNIMEQHRDHKSAAAYINMLLKNKKHKKDLKIAFYEVWAALAAPNCFIDITQEIDIKKAMINKYASQTAEYSYMEKACALNFYRGLNVKREYAESFMLMDIKLFRKILKACAVI